MQRLVDILEFICFGIFLYSQSYFSYGQTWQIKTLIFIVHIAILLLIIVILSYFKTKAVEAVSRRKSNIY